MPLPRASMHPAAEPAPPSLSRERAPDHGFPALLFRALAPSGCWPAGAARLRVGPTCRVRAPTPPSSLCPVCGRLSLLRRCPPLAGFAKPSARPAGPQRGPRQPWLRRRPRARASMPAFPSRLSSRGPCPRSAPCGVCGQSAAPRHYAVGPPRRRQRARSRVSPPAGAPSAPCALSEIEEAR